MLYFREDGEKGQITRCNWYAVSFHQFFMVRPPAFLNALNFCLLIRTCASSKGVPHVHTESLCLPWSLPRPLWAAVGSYGGGRWEAGGSIGQLCSRHVTRVWKIADKSYVGGRIYRIWWSWDFELFKWNTWVSLRQVLSPKLFWNHCSLCSYNQKILRIIPVSFLPLTTLQASLIMHSKHP